MGTILDVPFGKLVEVNDFFFFAHVDKCIALVTLLHRTVSYDELRRRDFV